MRLGALEAGGTKMVLAVGDETGRIERKVVIPTENPKKTMPKMIAFFKDALELAMCEEVWELEADYIAQALVNYILVLSPKRIVLGGGVMNQMQLFPLIRSKVTIMLNGYLVTKELEHMDHYIVPAGLDGLQGIMGCLRLATLCIER